MVRENRPSSELVSLRKVVYQFAYSWMLGQSRLALQSTTSGNVSDVYYPVSC